MEKIGWNTFAVCMCLSKEGVLKYCPSVEIRGPVFCRDMGCEGGEKKGFVDGD